MRRFLLLLMIVLLPLTALAQSMDDYTVDRFRARDVVGGAVIIARDGEILYGYDYGWKRASRRDAVTLDTPEELAMLEGAGLEVAGIMAITKAAALAYLMFNLFTPPCFAALGAMNSEINDRKWFWGGVGLQFATGFVVAYLVYQIGTLITTGAVGGGFLGGLIAVIAIVAIIAYLCVKGGKSAGKDYALSKK